MDRLWMTTRGGCANMPDPGRPADPDGEPEAMWIRLDDALLADERFLALTIDEKAGYVAILLSGVRVSGRWPNRHVLEDSLPRWVPASTVEACIRVGLLTIEDEAVTVPDDGAYGPMTGAQRVAAHRSRKRARNEIGNEGANEPSFSFAYASRERAYVAPAREGDDYHDGVRLVEDLTGRAYAIPSPSSKMGEALARMLAKHGRDRVMAEMAAAAARVGPMPTVAQVIFGAGNVLDAIPRADADCSTCLNMGIDAAGRSCPDCRRGRAH